MRELEGELGLCDPLDLNVEIEADDDEDEEGTE